MWSCLLAVVAVVSLAACDESGPGVPPGFRQLLEPRLLASGIRLARMEKELKELHDRLDKAKKIDPQGFLNDLNDRIDHVEAKKDHCDSRREVRCGRDSLECVSSLLLCDGHKDCHNGWDEDSHTCSPGPAVSGNVFVGTAHWTRCQNRHDHPVKITITGSYKANFFGARLGVRGVVAADFEEHDHEHREFQVRGMYNYGTKRLTLFPQTGEASREHYGVICDFVHGNDETAECTFTSEGTLFPCATFHVNLQH